VNDAGVSGGDSHLRGARAGGYAQAIRFALCSAEHNKKNWLFVGHPAAGDRAAVIYSLIVSCQRHGHNPHDYLRDVLSRLPAMTTADDLRPLLPSQWQPQPRLLTAS
jgi:hypothetical protein